MIKEIFASVLLACNFGTPILKTPYKANNEGKVSNLYNLRDELDYSYFDDFTEVYPITLLIDKTYNETTENRRYTNPCWIDNKVMYFYQLDADYSISGHALNMTLYFYNDEDTDYTISYEDYFWYDESDATALQDLPQYLQELVIDIREPMYLSGIYYAYWYSIFTHSDNEFVTSYTGYYTFSNTRTAIDYRTVMLGSIMMFSSNVYGLYGEQQTGNNTNRIKYLTYNSAYDKYGTGTRILPMTTENQWYISASKMPKSSYLRWSSYGTFGYVPQTTPDSYSFKDLFFSFADTPIYFIYSLFNWQLFGANLFIAFIGLTSFALLLVLFRRFL